MHDDHSLYCGLCITLGVVAPWFLLIFGAILGIVSGYSAFGQASAYFMALGLVLMAGSAGLALHGRLKH